MKFTYVVAFKLKLFLLTGVARVTCLVVSPAERDRGGSSKVAEAVYVY